MHNLSNEGKGERRIRHKAPLFIAAGVVLVICAATACLLGSSSVGLADLWALVTGGELRDSARSILMNVRFPRVIAALLAGSGLAVAGALIQAVLDNPLASPNIIVSIPEQVWRYCWLVLCFPVGFSCLLGSFHRCLDKRADHLWHLVWYPDVTLDGCACRYSG